MDRCARRYITVVLLAGVLAGLMLPRVDANAAARCPTSGSWVLHSAVPATAREKFRYDNASARTILLEVRGGAVTVSEPFRAVARTARRCSTRGLAVLVPEGSARELFRGVLDAQGDMRLRSTRSATTLHLVALEAPSKSELASEAAQLVGSWLDGDGPAIRSEITLGAGGYGRWYQGPADSEFRWKVWPCALRTGVVSRCIATDQYPLQDFPSRPYRLDGDALWVGEDPPVRYLRWEHWPPTTTVLTTTAGVTTLPTP